MPRLALHAWSHSFSWVDSTSATSTSILIHSQNDNPWALELNSLELYSLSLLSSNSRLDGVLRCPDAILCKRAIAVWIRPHNRPMVSHWEEHDGSENSSQLSSPLHLILPPKFAFSRFT
ncbi:uncharacterized protein ARMOST_20892 [Armillaria ostoyae]|uniref:Uncharacterized protein n=1 Tax=Armillaria ostoyae TaxID=47428 RepID=A0A284S8K1_ARMOS|nr:uncharacterized protein ARMOST_20892 [Armillaria ostoyae]